MSNYRSFLHRCQECRSIFLRFTSLLTTDETVSNWLLASTWFRLLRGRHVNLGSLFNWKFFWLFSLFWQEYCFLRSNFALSVGQARGRSRIRCWLRFLSSIAGKRIMKVLRIHFDMVLWFVFFYLGRPYCGRLLSDKHACRSVINFWYGGSLIVLRSCLNVYAKELGAINSVGLNPHLNFLFYVSAHPLIYCFNISQIF